MNHVTLVFLPTVLSLTPAFAAESFRVDHTLAQFCYTPAAVQAVPRFTRARIDSVVPCEDTAAQHEFVNDKCFWGLTYERGHQNPANHLGYSELSIRQFGDC